jgi:tetraacyldisaccharide 4'-kinase
MYALGVLRVHHLPVPVIVVGNVIAGGAGKTPTVIGLVSHLRARGLRPGVLSRGYGGNHQHATEVSANSTPAQVGDEPLLLRSSGAPVVVGRDRIAAGKLLLQLHPEVTHIVCDDGMQHYRLFRDIEICIFDARGLGNGRLIPAGLLRQKWPRRGVSVSGQTSARMLVLKTGASSLPGYRADRRLAAEVHNGLGERRTLDSLLRDGTPIHALAGIAQPESFFSMLRATGIALHSTEALPDHYAFDSYPRTITGPETLICTEKDAAKLWRHRPDAWAVALEQTLPEDFLQALDALL